MSFIDTAYAYETLPIVAKISDAILNPLITVLFTVALIFFLYGLFEFLKGSEDPDAVKSGKQHMFWGIIGLFIMVSAYGILNFVVDFVSSIK